MSTPIGQRRHRITFQAPPTTPDGMGGFTGNWTAVATVWARAWTVSSNETLGAGQQSMTRIQKFNIRYRAVNSEWRIEWGNRYFAITGIDPDERLTEIFLTCKEAA